MTVQLTLLRNAEVWSPEYQGCQDVLLGGGQILATGDIGPQETRLIQEIDLQGRWLVPGFVDSLTHITGGGGEGGFHTRTPEMQLSDAILGGVTTVTGVLGTDSVTRSHENLIAKARGLKAEGLNVVCLTGSYQVPARSLTESVERDILFIDEFIGAGEIAISDHRSSQPSVVELAKLAAEVRVAGMLSGKKGMLSVHVGAEASMLEPLWQVCDLHDVRLNQFYPTHINRNRALLDAGLDHVRMGGYIDFTASTNDAGPADGEVPAIEAVRACIEAGICPDSFSMSTDGHASLPVFDEQGQLIRLDVGKMNSLLDEVRRGILELKLDPVSVLKTVTSNPARILGLESVGQIKTGARADLLVLDVETLALDSVWSGGSLMLDQGKLLTKGTFES